MKTKVLQIGAGSMGSRRLRDLTPLSDVELVLYDPRRDRRERAGKRFGVEAFDNLDAALSWEPEVLVISAPPNAHHQYVELALEKGLHSFCEATLWTYDYRKIKAVSDKKGLVTLPSCSLHFLPLVKEIKRICSQELGKLHSYQMCLSTYLPTWHPDEGAEFYARNRSTAAGREMVPFELKYLNDIFGTPVEVAGTVSRRGKLDMDSEDTWCLQMRLDNGAIGQLIVMMGCPQLYRKGWFAGTNGIVEFDVSTGEVRRNLPEAQINDTRNFGALTDVLESVYADEISRFIAAIRGESDWPHDYQMSAAATGSLAAAEKSVFPGRIEQVDPAFQPALFPDMY